MKILILITAFPLAFTDTKAESDEFVWSRQDQTGVRLGGRTQTIEVWGTEILFIQSAIRNESSDPIYIPVEFADMSLHAKTLEYRMKILRHANGPAADTNGYLIRELGHNLFPMPYGYHTAHTTPAYLVRLQPGEMVTFSPVAADLGDGPTISSLSVLLYLKIVVPPEHPPLFQVNRRPNMRFEEDYPKNFDVNAIPTGEWRVEVSLESAGKPAEPAGAGQPATGPLSRPEGKAKPEPDWAERDEFVWSRQDNTGVRLGGRMQTIEAWGTKILLIQSAIRNESSDPRYIPVEFYDMSLHVKTLEYRMKILRHGDDPFANADTDGYPILYLGAAFQTRYDRLKPFWKPPVTPAYLARLASGEMVTFSPVTADLGDGPTISSLSVLLYLKIVVPPEHPPLFQVNRSPKRRFQEEYLESLDVNAIPTGEWRVEVSLESAGKPAEQAGAGQPATAPESKPEGKDKPQPESKPAPR